ncbi:MAG: nucleotidyltransferase family protein, partial [Nanoarchaeota archaeon]|nr:nucleotidyltransferase family protein [Nanoarchaeota archaeon]
RLYPLTEHQPKPLLKVGNKTILEHIFAKLEQVKGLNEAYIVTNDKFYPAFTSWVKNYKTPFQVKILNDGTKNNEDRLGAVGDINFVVQQEKINDDLLVIAGDNLFGFSLLAFTDFFKNKNSSVVAFHDLKDKNKVKGKYGVGIVQGSKVIDFEEKPAAPKSSLASTACYLFKRNDLMHIQDLVKMGKVDAPGNLIKYLATQSQVHAFVFDEHWFDVGSFESLREAQKVYER